MTKHSFTYNLTQKSWYQSLRKEFWRKPSRLTALKVVIASIVQVIPFSIFINPFWGTTLSLGTVAAALAETDDHPRGRLKALIITIISFAITTTSVAVLKPYPIIFGVGFISSTILFVLIGGVSERYRGISYGAILIGIYAMLGLDKNMEWYLQPLLLCSGALFYGALSLFLLYKKPGRLVEEQLSRGFNALSAYLEEKAKFFPISENKESNISSKLAILNVNVVTSLEKCKEVINNYGEEVKDQKELAPFLQRFMLLQSLHERAASSHERYEKLKDKTEYKEILEGFAELLHQLSHASKTLAESMLTGQKYNHPVSIAWIISALEFEIDKLPDYDRELLELLLHNLTRSHTSLKNLYNPEISTSIPRLGQDERSFWKRIKDQLTIKHPRFRYAIRLSMCFLVGYIIVITNNMEKGEWIILTSLFVCQPTYSETKKRLLERILGTLSGVVLGILLVSFMPTFAGQILLILLSIYFFFYFRSSNYSYAVVFITIYVLAGNNMTRNMGVEVMLPRLIDTIIGAALAFLSIRFLWPNWQHKQLPNLLSSALKNNAFYLSEIWDEYKYPKEDDYNYRLARRLAHKSDNALTLSWQSMRVEPKKRKHALDNAFTITYLNHVLLSYISAFGAQRDELKALPLDTESIINTINLTLKEAASRISNIQPKDTKVKVPLLKPLLIKLRDQIDQLKDSKQKQQLRLLYNIAGVSNKLLRESEDVVK